MVFSTDPVPSKSKTKCMLFCGKAGRVQYPDPVKLDGKDLPWVECADHLGHTLHQETNMDRDSKRARARFIDRTVEIREELFFARPEQVMRAVQILSTDSYGSMLWALNSAEAESLWRHGLITSLFHLKQEKYHNAMKFTTITRMIDSLCST